MHIAALFKKGAVVYVGGKEGRVTEIGEYAFTDTNEVTNVTVPDSVTKIGTCAFAQMDKLTDLYVPDSVKDIAEKWTYQSEKVTVHCSEGSAAYEACQKEDIKTAE